MENCILYSLNAYLFPIQCIDFIYFSCQTFPYPLKQSKISISEMSHIPQFRQMAFFPFQSERRLLQIQFLLDQAILSECFFPNRKTAKIKTINKTAAESQRFCITRLSTKPFLSRRYLWQNAMMIAIAADLTKSRRRKLITNFFRSF